MDDDLLSLARSNRFEDRQDAARLLARSEGSESDPLIIELLTDRNGAVAATQAAMLIRERRAAGVRLMLHALGTAPVTADDFTDGSAELVVRLHASWVGDVI